MILYHFIYAFIIIILNMFLLQLNDSADYYGSAFTFWSHRE